jgi:hypothetical protein
MNSSVPMTIVRPDMDKRAVQLYRSEERSVP